MVLIVVVIIVIAIAAIAWSIIAARKRREAMAGLAQSLGLRFNASKDFSFDERYHFIKKLCQGSQRYAFNIIDGSYKDHLVAAFDYHYETYSTDSDGNRSTQHHYFSFFILHFDANFPELIITREGWTSKVAQFFGYDDIDFESAEFSRKFCVRSTDKKFAYDVCHARAIEFLLANDDLNIEIDQYCLTMFFSRRLSPEQIVYNLDRMVHFRELIPDYVMER